MKEKLLSDAICEEPQSEQELPDSLDDSFTHFFDLPDSHRDEIFELDLHFELALYYDKTAD